MSKQPETSQEAKALKTDESKQADYDRILGAYMAIRRGHYEDAAKYMGEKDLNVVSRRMKEMRELGYLENTGEKKLTSRNRNAFVHKLGDKWNQKVVKDRTPKPTPASIDKIPVKAHFRTIKKENLNTGQQNLFDL